MTLPYDETRCHDSGCPERRQCLRWLERDAPVQGLSHAASLFPFDMPLAERCPYRVAPDMQAKVGNLEALLRNAARIKWERGDTD